MPEVRLPNERHRRLQHRRKLVGRVAPNFLRATLTKDFFRCGSEKLSHPGPSLTQARIGSCRMILLTSTPPGCGRNSASQASTCQLVKPCALTLGRRGTGGFKHSLAALYLDLDSSHATCFSAHCTADPNAAETEAEGVSPTPLLRGESRLTLILLTLLLWNGLMPLL